MEASSPEGAKVLETLDVVFERELVISDYPFLKSHVMSSKAVLPVAVIMEWLSSAAIHNNPGFMFHGFDNLRVYNGVVLNPDKPPKIRILASKTAVDGENYLVKVELRGGLSYMKLHTSATVILSKKLPLAPERKLNITCGTYKKTVAEAYKDVLFHGETFYAIKDVESSSDDGLIASLTTAPSPFVWMNEPFASSWHGDPLVLDGVYQLMILWTDQHLGELSLPNFFNNYRQFVPQFPKSGVNVVISAKRKNAAAANADVEFINDNGDVLATMTGYECTMSPSLRKAFKGRTLD